MKQHALLVAVAAMFLVAGCATRKAPPRKIVTVESKEPVEVRDAAHRVAVRVTDEVLGVRDGQTRPRRRIVVRHDAERFAVG